MEGLCQNGLFRMEKNLENPCNTVGTPVDNSTGHFPITSLEGFGYTRLSWALLTEKQSEQGHFQPCLVIPQTLVAIPMMKCSCLNIFMFCTCHTLRTALFWVVMQRVVVISCRRFGTTDVSHILARVP